jgi:transposase
MPSLPIEKGRPGPALLSHVLVSKFGDHLRKRFVIAA